MVWVQLPHTHVCVECERLRTEHVSLQGIAVDQWSRIEASSHPMGNILSYISLSMVNFQSSRDPKSISKVAVNVEKRLAERGHHLNQLCVLDRQLYCSINIRGVSSQVQSGAFLWYLLSPTSEHLDLLAADMVQSSDNQKNNDNNTAVFQCFKSNKDGTMEEVTPSQLSSSSRKDDPLTQQLLLCYNDIELCVANENVWSVMNHKARGRVEMTMSSSMEMMNSKRGLIPGNYRVDFYHSQAPFGDKFYNLNKILPKATQSAHFQVL